MMKIGKLLLVMVVVLSIFLSGCSYEITIEHGDNGKPQQSATPTKPTQPDEPFIGFSETEVEKPDQMTQVKLEDLQSYTSKYSQYNSYTYFDQLNDAEKLLYHAYEYALDEAQSCFWIEEQLLEEMERPIADILEFLALDSAMVGQNYEHREGEATLILTDGDVQTVEKTYTVILVDHFEKEELQRKEEAVEKAKQILHEMPETSTKREKAEYFYDYLGTNVTYEASIEGLEYLYMALCEERTNCDGYTNSFALLCSMADIPCVEIISDTPEGEIGHTWNAIFIDDQWVYVDCTMARGDVTSENQICRDERPYFGFSDDLLVYPMLHESIVPDCPEGLTPVMNIASGKIEDFAKKVKAEFEANDRKFAVILVDEGDLEKQMDSNLANELGFAFYSFHYETAEGKMVYYMFNND